MTINEYLEKHKEFYTVGDKEYLSLRPHIFCKSGLKFSAQASEFHYCSPRHNSTPYFSIEIGYPSERVEKLIPYAENSNDPSDTVYSWVSVELIDEIIEENGGIVNE